MVSYNHERYIYTLNQFAEKVGVQPNTVRTWDKTNRLKPAFVTDGGHRRYTHEQVLKVLNKKNSIQNVVLIIFQYECNEKTKTEKAKV